jgi:hypothetical protein
MILQQVLQSDTHGNGESLAGGGRVGLAVGNHGGCGRAVLSSG